MKIWSRTAQVNSVQSDRLNIWDTWLTTEQIDRVQSGRLNILNTWLTTDQVTMICRTIMEKENLVLEDLSLPEYSGVGVEENVKDRAREKVKIFVGL